MVFLQTEYKVYLILCSGAVNYFGRRRLMHTSDHIKSSSAIDVDSVGLGPSFFFFFFLTSVNRHGAHCQELK